MSEEHGYASTFFPGIQAGKSMALLPQLVVPAHVALDETNRDLLVWRFAGGESSIVDRESDLRDPGLLENRESNRYVKPTPRLLDDFMGLIDASREKILSFARRWGVLGICEHGLPASHNPKHYLVGIGLDYACEPIGSEKLIIWQSFARQARGILNVAECLYFGKKIERKYWNDVQEGICRQYVSMPGLTLMTSDQQRGFIAALLDDWLSVGHVRIKSNLEIKKLGFVVAYDGLFGALAFQILQRLAGRPVMCSGCNMPFFLEHRRGRQGYCSHCHPRKNGRIVARAAQRKASHTYSKKHKVERQAYDRKRYQDKKRARELFAEEVSIEAVAAQLDETILTIQGWFREWKREGQES